MDWRSCKNILCIRPDNMGDVIMTTPALHAIKETFNCRITLLTSNAGSLITPYISSIDETIVFDLPWVKNNSSIEPVECLQFIEKLRTYQFDGAIIFTVYSQNPLPTVLLAYLADIPLRLAYCRENSYQLLTDWIPDKEPYSYIQHQVKRDLGLVAKIGARTSDESLSLSFSEKAFNTAMNKLESHGVDINDEWILMHPCVSESKREYPAPLWIETAELIHRQTNKQILLTGAAPEKKFTGHIQQEAGDGIFSIAGLLNIEEFIALVAHSPLLISVNTAAVHIAAAVKTPVIVLYALTNPQHTPWKTPSVVLPFEVDKKVQSKNEIIQYVNRIYFDKPVTQPTPEEIFMTARKLLRNNRISAHIRNEQPKSIISE